MEETAEFEVVNKQKTLKVWFAAYVRFLLSESECVSLT